MKFKYISIVFLSFFSFVSHAVEIYQTKALIIMGASCSGKSSLSKKLLEYLDKSWKLIEFDVIEDVFKEVRRSNDRCDNEVMNELVNESNDALKEGYNIIIDTNVYDEKLTQIKSNFKRFVFIYCPLDTLRQRNQKRDNDFKRDQEKAKRAGEYVEETFQSFEGIQHDICIDSSIVAIEESCAQIVGMLDDNKTS